MFNAPVNDSVTIRGVVYRDDQGGYIDNVQGTLTALESARFREAGTMRSNGVPVSDLRAGFQTQTYIDSDSRPVLPGKQSSTGSKRPCKLCTG